MRTLLVAALSIASTFAGAQTWQYVATEADITAASAMFDSAPRRLAVNSAGIYALVDGHLTTPLPAPESAVFLVDPSASPKVTLAQTQSALIAALNAANGTDPAPSSLTIQAIDFNADGQIIVYTDGPAPQTGAVFAIAPTPPYTINVLSCAKNGNASPVEGGVGMFNYGNISFLLMDRDNDAVQDRVMGLYTNTLVNDGSLFPWSAIGESSLLAATGESTAATMFLNDGEAVSSYTLYLINSGLTGSNDNVVRVSIPINPGGPVATASLYVAATDIESDIGDTDVGYNAMTLSNGTVVLANSSGGANADDGILFVNNITPPNGTTTFDSEAKIAGDIGGTEVALQARSLVFNPATGRIAVTSDIAGAEGILTRTDAQAAAAEWSLYE